MIYRVVHRTEYRYDSEVSSSYGELYLLPRDVPGQVCRSSEVVIEPEAYDYRQRKDFYGNRVAYFARTGAAYPANGHGREYGAGQPARLGPVWRSTRPGKRSATVFAPTAPQTPLTPVASCSTHPRS